MRTKLSYIIAGGLILALSAFGIASAVTEREQHFRTTITTNFGGFDHVVLLQSPVDPADTVVKVHPAGTNLGGEDPSLATVNFAGFVDLNDDVTDGYEAIAVRAIGWHAVATGQAEFRYYSNKSAAIFVDVYPRTPVTLG